MTAKFYSPLSRYNMSVCGELPGRDEWDDSDNPDHRFSHWIKPRPLEAHCAYRNRLYGMKNTLYNIRNFLWGVVKGEDRDCSVKVCPIFLSPSHINSTIRAFRRALRDNSTSAHDLSRELVWKANKIKDWEAQIKIKAEGSLAEITNRISRLPDRY